MVERVRGVRRRKGKGKGRKTVFFSVSTQIFPLQHSVSLHISPECQGSGRQAQSGETTHTFSFQKTSLGSAGWSRDGSVSLSAALSVSCFISLFQTEIS